MKKSQFAEDKKDFCGVLFGFLTRAGTLEMHYDHTTGFIVSCSVEYLKAVPRLPMYRRVAIIEADALGFRRFEHVLRKHGIIDPAALDDPEGYDHYRKHGLIHAAHRELTSSNASDEPTPLLT